MLFSLPLPPNSARHYLFNSKKVLPYRETNSKMLTYIDQILFSTRWSFWADKHTVSISSIYWKTI